MKPFVFIVFVFGVLFKLEAQADFLTLAEQKICDQIKTDDVKIHLVADSLFQYVDEEGDLKTKAYLHYWKALGYYRAIR